MWKKILLGTVLFLGISFISAVNTQQIYACTGVYGTGCGGSSYFGVCCSGEVCVESSGNDPQSNYCLPISDNGGYIGGSSSLECAYNSGIPAGDNLEFASTAPPGGAPAVVAEYCGAYGLDCSPNLGCYNSSAPTCSGSISGAYCTSFQACGHAPGYVVNGNSYDCSQVCCRPEQCSDVAGARCSKQFTSCTSFYGNNYMDYNNGQLDNTCSSGLAQCCVQKPNCNGGLSCGGFNACHGAPGNTCWNGNGTQSQTCTYTTYNGSTTCIQQSYTNTQSCTQNNCSNNYACSGGNCITNIYVHVYTDYNHNGIVDGNDRGQANVQITDGGGNYPLTDANGNVTFTGKTTGNYTISMAVPAGYTAVGATSQNVGLNSGNGNASVTFLLTPLYQISGNIFNDANKDTKYDNGESLYTQTSTIHITGGPTNVNDMTQTSGTYNTGELLESGTYTVSQTAALASGYFYTTPSTWAITVGNPTGSPACSTGSSPDAVCTNPNSGSIANLNFGLTDETPWSQTVCMDLRNDSGTFNDPLPAAPSCGGVTGSYVSVANADCSTGAGIVFTCNGTPSYGLGQANANGWQAGGTGVQQECFTGAGLNVIDTSYEYLETTAQQSGITPTDLSLYCSLSSCTLPSNLPKGIYQANGDVNLNAYTFPVDPNNPQAFIFLINGDLHIDGNILVPAGSVASFSTSALHSIYVAPNVGNAITNTSDPNVNNPNIEGLYSADANFVVQSNTSGNNVCNPNGTPLDNKLNIVGSVVTNAGQQGGAFENNRDLCEYDLECSPVTIGEGNPDGSGTTDEGLGTTYLLTLYADGGFLNHQQFNWEELKP